MAAESQVKEEQVASEVAAPPVGVDADAPHAGSSNGATTKDVGSESEAAETGATESDDKKPEDVNPEGAEVAEDDEENEEEVDEEEDEDDEDIDDDEEDEIRSRKRRKRNQFLDVEAEVDDDDEEDEDEEEAELLKQTFIQDDHIEHDEGAGPTANDDRLHRKLDRSREKIDEQDAQQLAEELRQRYGRSSAARYTGSSSAQVSQRLLLPSVDDPNIWGIRCRAGKEKELVRSVMGKMMNRQSIQIYSIFQRDNFEGYVYIEARKLDAVNEVLQGLPYVYPSSPKVLVPIEEYKDLLRPGKSSDVQLLPGSYVRIKSGKYKGDLGIVVDVLENDLEVRLRIVPRLDYGRSVSQTVIDSTGNAAATKKRSHFDIKSRPPQRLFSESDALMYDRTGISARSGKRFTYRNEEYVDGFLFKDFKIQILEVKNVKPTLEELTLFRTGEEDGMDLSSIASTLKQSTDSQITFQPGDRVEVKGGEQGGMKGRVTSAQQEKIITITIDDPNFPMMTNTTIEVPSNNLRKVFFTGDHVRVVHGKHTDDSGLIVEVTGDQVTFVSDQTRKDITVFSNYLTESSDVSASASQVGRFDLHDLVEINSDSVGVIIKAEKEAFTVLRTDGRVLVLAPSSISSKIELSSYQQIATDRNGVEVKIGDVVKEVSGERRQGNVIHMYRSYLFLKSKVVTENSGVFVVNVSAVQTISTKGTNGGSKGPDLNKMNPNRSMPPPSLATVVRFTGRDPTINKHVTIRRGGYKGKKGIVKDANGDTCRVELHAPSKTVPIKKDDLRFEANPGNFVSYEDLVNNSRGSRNSGTLGYSAGPPGARLSSGGPNGGSTVGWSSGKTPAWGAGGKTPAWGSGGKTPAWGSETSYGGAGARTPGWGAGSKTPAWGSDTSYGNSGAKTPAWGSGGKTPAWGGDGGKTPAWGGEGGKTPAWGGRSAYGGNTDYGSRSAWGGNDRSSGAARAQDHPTGGWAANTPGFQSANTPGFHAAPTPGGWDAPTPANVIPQTPAVGLDDEDDYDPETRTP
ncbi:unnamed protein product [Kuraishia capsulata CBS 1993]|uniref:Transcription elongation factor SPT5 n=1 Tax=Kuraishia capsulata CBS 1993 TaxID=1382522 RepID=W6MWQ3_9ASCO|nr:uncharacterized protein KUCA_T00003719001 [Kuraishia capsulata CBS 1993]CDK27740.1 unnamed protein product [Kuraishia capsulata CBS 1993]